MLFDLEQYRGGSDFFVSFTELAKVGVNPGSIYNTPIGVYAYPLGVEEIWHQLHYGTLPFAGDMRFANVLQATSDRILHIDQATEADADLVANKIADILDPYVESQQHLDELLEGPFASQGHRIWQLTRRAALLVVSHRAGLGRQDVRDEDVQDQLGWGNRASATMWNLMLRKIGFDVIVDEGAGIIHTNEPIQAVFLVPTAYKLVERVENNRWKFQWRNKPAVFVTTLAPLLRAWNTGLLDTVTLLRAVQSIEYLRKNKSSPIQVGPFVIDGSFQDIPSDQMINRLLDALESGNKSKHTYASKDDFRYAVRSALAHNSVSRNLSDETKRRINGF